MHQSLKNGLGVSEIRLTQNSLFHFSFLNIEVFLFWGRAEEVMSTLIFNTGVCFHMGGDRFMQTFIGN